MTLLYTKLLRGLDERLRARGWPTCTELLGDAGGWISVFDMSQFEEDATHHTIFFGDMSSIESHMSHCGGFDRHIYTIEKDNAGLWAVFKYTNRARRRPVRTAAEFAIPARRPRSTIQRQ